MQCVRRLVSASSVLRNLGVTSDNFYVASRYVTNFLAPLLCIFSLPHTHTHTPHMVARQEVLLFCVLILTLVLLISDSDAATSHAHSKAKGVLHSRRTLFFSPPSTHSTHAHSLTHTTMFLSWCSRSKRQVCAIRATTVQLQQKAERHVHMPIPTESQSLRHHHQNTALGAWCLCFVRHVREGFYCGKEVTRTHGRT